MVFPNFSRRPQGPPTTTGGDGYWWVCFYCQDDLKNSAFSYPSLFFYFILLFYLCLIKALNYLINTTMLEILIGRGGGEQNRKF